MSHTADGNQHCASAGARSTGHDFDDDSVCRECGFDGAEWWHLERMKAKEDRQPQPRCSVALHKDHLRRTRLGLDDY